MPTRLVPCLQEDEYYAFGLRKMGGINNGNRYLYNGKEIQTNLENQYDYGARFYDPVMGRWTSVDPLVEMGQESTSPYGYVYDNPIKNTDPDGRVPSVCCKTAKMILGGSLLLAGGEVAVAAPTIFGEAIAVPAAVATVGAGLVVSGVALIFDAFSPDPPHLAAITLNQLL